MKVIVLVMPICYKFETCKCEKCANQFAKDNHIDNFFIKKGGKNGEGMS